mgnify:FL=1
MKPNEEEQLVRQGNNAEALLGTDAFSETIDAMVHSSFQTFVNSKHADTADREQAYGQYRALVDLVSTLQQQVSVKNEITELNNRDNNEEVE